MHLSGCSLLLIIIGALYSQDLVLGEEEVRAVKPVKPPPNDRTCNQGSSSPPTDPSCNQDSSKKDQDPTVEETILTNLVLSSDRKVATDKCPDKGVERKVPEVNTSATEYASPKTIQKKEINDIDDKIFNDFKRFLLFPFLPLLLPPAEEKEQRTSHFTEDEAVRPKDTTNTKLEKGLSAKPFILFDFAFNIREIPVTNGTKTSANDSKVINVKKVDNKKPMPTKDKEDQILEDVKELQKTRRRRNISKRNQPDFFDNFPLFPDPPVDDFLLKPNLFFPGLSPHKPSKRMSRRKRDMKKPDINNDLEFIMDAIYQTFMQTKNEFEQTNPVLNFLKGAETPFEGESSKKNDLFTLLPDAMRPDQDRPNLNFKIQKNIRRLNGDPQDKSLSPNSPEAPMIIVDKVVQIGEFHVRDDNHDKKKLTDKKRSTIDLKKKLNDGINHDEVRIPLKFEKDKESEKIEVSNDNQKHLSEDSEKKKRTSDAEYKSKNFNVKSKEIKVLPPTETSHSSSLPNVTIEVKERNENANEDSGDQDDFVKIIDSIKKRIKIGFSNNPASMMERKKRQPSWDRQNSKVPVHDDLKKNIKQVLNRFFELVKKIDDAKLIDKLEANEQEIDESFDWTEKETLQNVNNLGKNSMNRKSKKELQFEEYLDAEKKGRQAADLNYLFYTVTLPTMLVFALVLLVCFFNLQVKGKICTKLFKPRQIFLVEEKPSAQFGGKGTVRIKSPQPI